MEDIEQPQRPKKRWELEAEEMKRNNQLRRGIITPRDKKFRYEKRAYRLLMTLHAKEYWGVGEKEPSSDHRSRKIRSTRKQIRIWCQTEAHQLMLKATSIREHRAVIKSLQQRVLEQRRQVREDFKRVVADVAGDEVEQMKAEVKAREEAAVDAEIEAMKAEVWAREGRRRRAKGPRREKKDLPELTAEVKKLKREVLKAEGRLPATAAEVRRLKESVLRAA